jgi:hypothetical protein
MGMNHLEIYNIINSSDLKFYQIRKILALLKVGTGLHHVTYPVEGRHNYL